MVPAIQHITSYSAIIAMAGTTTTTTTIR